MARGKRQQRVAAERRAVGIVEVARDAGAVGSVECPGQVAVGGEAVEQQPGRCCQIECEPRDPRPVCQHTGRPGADRQRRRHGIDDRGQGVGHLCARRVVGPSLVKDRVGAGGGDRDAHGVAVQRLGRTERLAGRVEHHDLVGIAGVGLRRAGHPKLRAGPGRDGVGGDGQVRRQCAAGRHARHQRLGGADIIQPEVVGGRRLPRKRGDRDRVVAGGNGEHGRAASITLRIGQALLLDDAGAVREGDDRIPVGRVAAEHETRVGRGAERIAVHVGPGRDLPGDLAAQRQGERRGIGRPGHGERHGFVAAIVDVALEQHGVAARRRDRHDAVLDRCRAEHLVPGRVEHLQVDAVVVVAVRTGRQEHGIAGRRVEGVGRGRVARRKHRRRGRPVEGQHGGRRRQIEQPEGVVDAVVIAADRKLVGPVQRQRDDGAARQVGGVRVREPALRHLGAGRPDEGPIQRTIAGQAVEIELCPGRCREDIGGGIAGRRDRASRDITQHQWRARRRNRVEVPVQARCELHRRRRRLAHRVLDRQQVGAGGAQRKAHLVRVGGRPEHRPSIGVEQPPCRDARAGERHDVARRPVEAERLRARGDVRGRRDRVAQGDRRGRGGIEQADAVAAGRLAPVRDGQHIIAGDEVEPRPGRRASAVRGQQVARRHLRPVRARQGPGQPRCGRQRVEQERPVRPEGEVVGRRPSRHIEAAGHHVARRQRVDDTGAR